VAISLLVTGCGQSPGSSTSSTATTGSASTTGLTSPPPTDSSTSTEPRSVDDLFAQLATSSQPMTIFEPTFLPEGTSLADAWRPVVDSTEPAAYEGPPVSNPQVLGSGPESEIQVVFQAGDGWLAVLENFRGDLGDVTGVPVGSVAGNQASLYEVNGGELVQWSKDGLWYGVFGRGLGQDDIVKVALGMQPRTAESR
jgi:hypothetical protein